LTIGLIFSSIEFKFNGTTIKFILVKKVLKIYLWIWCWKKKLLKRYKSKKTPFHASMFGNGLNKFFQMMTSKNDNFWNLKLSYLNQLQWIIITIFFCLIPLDIWFWPIKDTSTRLHSWVNRLDCHNHNLCGL